MNADNDDQQVFTNSMKKNIQWSNELYPTRQKRMLIKILLLFSRYHYFGFVLWQMSENLQYVRAANNFFFLKGRMFN